TSIEHESPLCLPSSLLPSEDLTYQARHRSQVPAITLQYQKRDKALKSYDPYDVINRALHRREKNHVLITGLRGVGKTTLVREVARRAAFGEIPFLKNKRFLWVEGQDVSHESEDTLEQLLSFATEQTDVILCIDGLGP